MGLLDQGVLEAISIKRMIFHVVGPAEDDLQLMDEMDASGFEDFFLERVRETNVGNRFQFIGKQSGVRPALKSMSDVPNGFLQLTKELAETFQSGHIGTPSTSRGTFIVAELSGLDNPAFALIKFDDQKVLRYQQTLSAAGKMKAKVSEIDKTFSEDRKAMQKSALILLTEEGGDLAVYDRTNKRNITEYFKVFLGVKRLWQPADATDRLKQAFESAFSAQSAAPEDIRRTWRKRLFDATRSRETIEPGEDFDLFGTEVFGSFWQNADFRKEVDRALHAKRISGEVIEIAKDRIKLPPMRRLKTKENVLILYPSQLDDAASVVTVERQPDGNATITIRTQGIIDDELTDEVTSRRGQ